MRIVPDSKEGDLKILLRRGRTCFMDDSPYRWGASPVRAGASVRLARDLLRVSQVQPLRVLRDAVQVAQVDLRLQRVFQRLLGHGNGIGEHPVIDQALHRGAHHGRIQVGEQLESVCHRRCRILADFLQGTVDAGHELLRHLRGNVLPRGDGRERVGADLARERGHDLEPLGLCLRRARFVEHGAVGLARAQRADLVAQRHFQQVQVARGVQARILDQLQEC
ncbi:hypothetical protein G6F31_017705 [Rhizopus arrhizus]|nr:hypothetical protein G6F31_017705 [Rhizopus arrhizus]